MSDRSSDLQTFLRHARSRITPKRAGLAVGGRRRVPGLRREEVAELAGISEVWYARFESGRAVLSVSALDRVAAALHLSRDERVTLMLLARPDVRGLTSAGLNDSFSGMMSGVTGLRDFARRSATASSFEELAQFAVRAVYETCGERSSGYFQRYVAESDEIPFVAAYGNGCEIMVGYRQHCSTVPYAMRELVDGNACFENDLRQSASHELRGRVELGFYAYYSQPIMGPGGLHSTLGAAFIKEPHIADGLEIRAIEAAAAITELTMRPYPSEVSARSNALG